MINNERQTFNNNIKDIEDTEECISEFTQMKKLEDNFKILNYIKSMNEKIISKFENYSKIYSSIIEKYIFE